MIEEIRAVPLGRPAGEALAVAVADVKERAGPLASVTVVVASKFAGLSARRLLASGTAGGRGVANVQFVTPFRLAEILPSEGRPGAGCCAERCEPIVSRWAGEWAWPMCGRVERNTRTGAVRALDRAASDGAG